MKRQCWSEICSVVNVNAVPYHPEKTHLLLVEDHPADARLIEYYLEESGFGSWIVTRTESLSEALEKLEANEYAIVLLDLTLPDGVGLVNIQRIKRRFPDQHIVVLTGFDERLLGMEAIKEGALDFLLKGDYDEYSLARALRFSIERGQFIRRLEETQKIALIGSWDYYPDSEKLILSDQLITLIRQKDQKVNEEVAIPYFRQLLDRIHRIVASGRKVNLDTKLELPDQGVRYFHVQCHAVQNAGAGNVYQGILQDITERYQTEEMRQARDVARKSAEIREQFIASISHEMRTPINAIIGLSNLLLGDGLAPEKRSMIQSIKDASDILLGIVNDILDFSAMKSGSIQLRSEAFSIRKLCYELERILCGKIQDKGLEWRMIIDEDLHDMLIGDKLRINQVLFNLLGNAIKFTHQGSVTLSVLKESSWDDKQFIRFEVSDTGIGIPEDGLKIIFDDFGRVRAAQAFYEGTGLGLAITRQLVERLEGSIHVESIFGQGSTFTVILPFKATAPRIADEPVVQTPIKAETAFSGMILLVEDHKMNQLVARKTIERKWPSATVLTAVNGKEALAMLDRQLVDIVLMDLHMPVMDGYEATQLIKKHENPAVRRIPVIAMTANAFIAGDDELASMGFKCHLLKPFEPEELYQVILASAPLKSIIV